MPLELPMTLSRPLILLALAATPVAAQTTVLDEDFSLGVPPAGWTVVDNSGSGAQGWIQDAVGLRAWHEDESGLTADDTLLSPVLDLSGLSQAYLHFSGQTNWAAYLANHPAGFGDGVSTMEVTTDGGLSWTVVWSDVSLVNGETYAPDVDLSAFAGSSTVQLGIHYVGTFAQEWWVDRVVIDDSATPPPPPGTTSVVNLPGTFAAVPFLEDFETAAGVVPPYMALTNIDEATGLVDPEAWCNIGQLAPCTIPFAGLYNLETGLIPGSTNYHQVRNAMVLGIDGSGFAGLNLDYQGYNAGEEANDFDGIWVSDDGTEWYRVGDTWNVAIPLDSVWTSIADLDLTGTPVDTTGEFYLMFGQEDNFPYDDLDGVGIDDIAVDGTGLAFSYIISNLVAGQAATFAVTGGTPFGQVLVAYSLTGAGPTQSQYGLVDMSLPISVLASLVTDLNGAAQLTPTVPPGVAGATLYTQCVDLTSGTLSNSLAILVQ
jgi:hypothetical protein